LQFLFCFRKQKIKGGKEKKRNSFRGQSTADGGGDFDVFKKQPRELFFISEVQFFFTVIVPIKKVFYSVNIAL
jgi:hypothetical protein